MFFPNTLTLIRGAGDLATGVIYRLYQAGFPVIATEVAQPTVVRRTVAFAQAVFDGETTVEGLTATRVSTMDEARTLAFSGALPILPNPDDDLIPALRPTVLIDARLLKRSDAACIDQAELVIGLGPGFTGGVNCHAAIETNRGHRLGRVLWHESAEANTGIPGVILGFSEERIIRAPLDGVFSPLVEIGDRVEQNQVVGSVQNGQGLEPVWAPLDGIVRGLIYAGLRVQQGMKIGDVDPRGNPAAIYTISDKSLAIGGAALAAILTWMNRSAASMGAIEGSTSSR